MVKITNDEIQNLKYISCGTFANVYKKDNNTAYKIYKDKIKTIMGTYMDNPALTINRLHYKLLLNRKSKVKGIDLLDDLLYVNGEFKGIVTKYYDGKTLKDLDIPIEKKIDISRKLIEYNKELTKHLIYHCDYKSNNMMLENDEVKLIDLDDLKTHAFVYPSPLFYFFSIKSLGNEIQELLGQHYNYLGIPKEVYINLKREKKSLKCTYSSINKYLERKEIKKDILFIDKDTDISRLKDNSSTYKTNIVYELSNKEQNKNSYRKIYNNLNIYNIPLYDITTVPVDRYKYIEMINEAYQVKDNEYKKVYHR